jgi:hypothetical protein
MEPFLSPDGNKLFFASNRPKKDEGEYPSNDFDIWLVQKTDSGWSEPSNLGLPVNTPADEFCPSIGNSGDLYFTSQRDSGFGIEDIYMAEWNGALYSEPYPLPQTINSSVYEFNAFINPDENLLIYTSYGRKDGPGGGDMYFSKKNKNGNWQQAKLLPNSINSNTLDFCPFYDEKNKTLYYTSERHSFDAKQNLKTFRDLENALKSEKNGNGDIYWCKVVL